MKKYYQNLVRWGIYALAGLCLFVFSCKGPEGPTGPIGSTGTKGDTGSGGANGVNGTVGATGEKGGTGAAGTNGTAGASGANGTNGKDGTNGASGANGTNGKDGNANVVYTDWTTPDWGGDLLNYSDYFYLNVKSTDTPVFTKEAIDKAVIYTYVKVQALDYVKADNEYKLFAEIQNLTNSSSVSYFRLAGRTSNKYEDYGYLYISGSNIRENYYKASINVYKNQSYNSKTGRYEPTPEFANKTAAEYRAVAKDIPQIRHVVIYGSTKGGRLAAINWKDYSEVKRTLNLKD